MQETLKRLRERREELGSEGGFTLIELLIVIVILAILAAIVVFAVSNLTGTSAQSACKSDYKTVESAAEAYKAQVGVYPGATVPTGYTATLGTGGNDASMNALLGTVANSGNTYGPWLKDNPLNAGHYEIRINTPTASSYTEQVYATDGTTQSPAPGTGAIADCSSVKYPRIQ